jgi:hypothetical protein
MKQRRHPEPRLESWGMAKPLGCSCGSLDLQALRHGRYECILALVEMMLLNSAPPC